MNIECEGVDWLIKIGKQKALKMKGTYVCERERAKETSDCTSKTNVQIEMLTVISLINFTYKK